MTGIDWGNVDATFAAANEWLDSNQAPGAMLSHIGPGNDVGGGVTIRFSPGASARPGGTLLIHVECRLDPLPVPDAVKIRRVVTSTFGAGSVVEEWGGDRSWSILVDTPIGDGISQARANYQTGCPTHGAVFCNGPDRLNPFATGCEHTLLGRQAHTGPAWVAHVYPDVAEPAQSQSEARNAEAVAAAIQRCRPLLAEFGVHADTVAVGALGELVGVPGSREFVAGDGGRLGVAVPAEVFEALVQAAVNAQNER